MAEPNQALQRHEFVAYHCGVDRSKWAVMVGFARDPVDESSLDGLILQRGRGADAESGGVDAVYVEIPIQRHVVYGGIREATLRKDSFGLRFDDRAAAAMGGFHEIIVRFILSEEELEEISGALQEVFVDCDCFHHE